MAAKQGGGKDRASRIPLDYYKKPDAIARWKLALSGLAILLALGWWASGFSFGGPGYARETDSGLLRYSHGPVARAHATWDARCDACHSAFRPIGQEAWTAKVGLSAGEADGKCMSCHAVEDHHPKAQAADDPSAVACAGCHRDHQGRDFSLVRLADSDCTSCHRDLKAHTKSLATSFADVASFPKGHPEFDLVAKKEPDPGTLKFNHALHMSDGLSESKGRKPLFTLAQLSPEDQDRYRRDGQSPADGVRLDCASCHRPDNGDLPPVSSPSGVEAIASLMLSGQGSYMRPISYRTDCAACHKLEVAMKLGGETTTIAVPHRLQPPALRESLTNISIGLSLGKDLKTLEKFAPSDRLSPGRRNDAEQGARAEVESRVAKSERILLGQGKGTCTECHQYKTPAGLTSTLDLSGPIDAVQVEPTFVETVWYKRGKFDHSAHRGVSCRGCHEGAYPDAKGASRTGADVLIPGKDSCVTCHAPEGRDASGEAVGGAGHNCTECHRYHGGDHAPGVGFAKDAAGMDFVRFLNGTGEQKSR